MMFTIYSIWNKRVIFCWRIVSWFTIVILRRCRIYNFIVFKVSDDFTVNEAACIIPNVIIIFNILIAIFSFFFVLFILCTKILTRKATYFVCMTATVVKRAWPKKILDDQKGSYDVFSGKVTGERKRDREKESERKGESERKREKEGEKQREKEWKRKRVSLWNLDFNSCCISCKYMGKYNILSSSWEKSNVFHKPFDLLRIIFFVRPFEWFVYFYTPEQHRDTFANTF